jgi:SulP family sulfate permease
VCLCFPRAAQRIGAEILFYREAVKKIAAESPVFLSVFGQKNAPNTSLLTPHSTLFASPCFHHESRVYFLPMLKPKILTTLREYDKKTFLNDISAGVIVGIVALPLSIAFAIASGVTPERGLFTAIIAGLIISFLGGSRVQIGGPTGAFVVIVYGIVERYEYAGLMTATIIAGVFLVLMGMLRLGGLIRFIPYTIITGFTAGIAVTILASQIGDFLGLEIASAPGDFAGRLKVYAAHIGGINWAAFGLSTMSLLIIIFWRRINKKIPGSLVAILVSTALVLALKLPVDTIGSRFGAIPAGLPPPMLPDFSLETVRQLIPSALSIAILGAVESLLSAAVADGMIGSHHRSNMELVAQGIANVVTPVFGGIPATGAIARTAANVRNGGRTPVAGIIHALTLLFIMLAFGKYAAYIPMPALAAILVHVAWNMSEVHAIKSILRGQKSDAAVLLVTFFITVFVDLSVAIETGLILAAFLFMKKMVDVTDITAVKEEAGDNREEDKEAYALATGKRPQGVFIYEIDGPFFFGSVQKLEEVMKQRTMDYRIMVLRMRNVNYIDATGLRAVEQLFFECKRQNRLFVISGIRSQPLKILEKTGFAAVMGRDKIFAHIDLAIKYVDETLAAMSGAEANAPARE